MTTKLCAMLLGVAFAATPGCYQGLAESTPTGSASAGEGPPGDGVATDGADADGDEEGDESGAPGHQGGGVADDPPGRQVRRMTAAQFHRSLVTATGQAWPLFDKYAAAMGKADFAEVIVEGRQLSVTFDKFAHDAAMYACGAAIANDLSATAPTPPVILRHATVSDRDPAMLRANLNYLMLRLLAQVMRDDDARVEPWLAVLTSAPTEGEFTDTVMAERWKAVCVGLITHPDFLTY